MFTLVRQSSPKILALVQAPSLVASLIIAELFYKFHSFLLETGAFLLTWFILDAFMTGVLRIAWPSQAGGGNL